MWILDSRKWIMQFLYSSNWFGKSSFDLEISIYLAKFLEIPIHRHLVVSKTIIIKFPYSSVHVDCPTILFTNLYFANGGFRKNEPFNLYILHVVLAKHCCSFGIPDLSSCFAWISMFNCFFIFKQIRNVILLLVWQTNALLRNVDPPSCCFGNCYLAMCSIHDKINIQFPYTFFDWSGKPRFVL